MAQSPSNSFVIKVNDAPLPDDVTGLVVSAYVDDNLNLPDLFVLTFRDPGRIVLDKGKMEIGAKLSVAVIAGEGSGPETLITGEITAVEAEFGPAGTFTVVRGFDHAHRLFRGNFTESYKNVTYSDVVKKVAARVNLPTGRIDPTTSVHEHVSQGNTTDWQFLHGLAREIGFEVAVLDGKLNFRAPTKSESAPDSGDMGSTNPLQLVPGTNLLRFRSTVTSAEQVHEVKVRGWNVAEKRVTIGRAPAETNSAELGVKPAELAKQFGNPVYVSDARFGGQAELDALAKALAEHIAGGFAELEGVARGNPKLKAGTPVSLGLGGKPFDGSYTLTTTRHNYDPDEGYTTWFTASGRQERSLFGLTSGNGAAGSDGAIPGVVTGIVTDVRDPDGLCRVKVKFPWMSDSFETHWARTAQVGAGKDRGAVNLPEVNDEVLVAFEQGDVRAPYVIAGLYNGVDKPPVGDKLIDLSTGGVNRRGFISKKGHGVVFIDAADKEGVVVMTGDQQLRISLNKTTKTVKISSNGDVVIDAQGAVTIQAKKNLELSGQKIILAARAGVSIDAGGGAFEAKGATAELEGSGKAEVKGATVDVKGSALVNVQGAMVKIN